MIARIEELMKHDTAGDPMTGLKWTHKTTVKIAVELGTLGLDVSPRTVARLLQQMGYSLRVNHKKLSRVSKTAPEDRNAQFEHITHVREDFAARGLPVISVDTKKKELVGRFKNPGAAWNREPVAVNDHDFPHQFRFHQSLPSRRDTSGVVSPSIALSAGAAATSTRTRAPCCSW